MKKFLSIIALSLLISTYVHASAYKKAENEWRNAGGAAGDPYKTIILDKDENYIVIRNTTAKTKVYHNMLKISRPAEIFLITGKKHCEKNKIYNFVSDGHKVIFDKHTLYYYCSVMFSNLKEFKNLELSKDEEKYLTVLWAKMVYGLDSPIPNEQYKAVLQKFPFFKSAVKRIIKHNYNLSNSSFIYEVKIKAFSEFIKTGVNQQIAVARQTCSLMGITSEIDKMSSCILDLYIHNNEMLMESYSGNTASE